MNGDECNMRHTGTGSVSVLLAVVVAYCLSVTVSMLVKWV